MRVVEPPRDVLIVALGVNLLLCFWGSLDCFMIIMTVTLSVRIKTAEIFLKAFISSIIFFFLLIFSRFHINCRMKHCRFTGVMNILGWISY